VSAFTRERDQPVDLYEEMDARSVFPNIRGRRPFPKIRRPRAPEMDRRNIPAVSDQVFENGPLGTPNCCFRNRSRPQGVGTAILTVRNDPRLTSGWPPVALVIRLSCVNAPPCGFIHPRRIDVQRSYAN